MYNNQKDENLVKFLSQTSKFTQSLPRKIQNWSKQKENKLKRLFVDEGRSIHAIARMLGGREYEIAEAIERFGFAQEPVQLKSRPHPMKGIKKSEYVPKWAREQHKAETVTITPTQTMAATPMFGVTPEPKKQNDVDPRFEMLYNFREHRDHYRKILDNLVKVDETSMSMQERVQHDLEIAKANEMYTWFANQYTQALLNLAEKMTESNRWTDAK